MWTPALGRRWKEENMLRVKKVSDAIFPRDFSKTMQSYINIFRDNFSRIKNVQISNIIKHYESKLLSIKNRIEEVEYSKKAKEILDLYNKDPYLYANKKKFDYQLDYETIKEIKNSVSTKIFKSKEEKEEIENLIKEKELEKIKSVFDLEFEKINKRYPPKINIHYKDTVESLTFQKEYKDKFEKYAKAFNLQLDSFIEPHYSNYSFILWERLIDGKKKNEEIIIDNKELTNSYGRFYTLFDINEENLKSNEKQVIMYDPVKKDMAFFLYKNCLYKAEFNEVFTDEELLLKVKEKIYKEDKKFEQLKKQIELYENSDISETSKKKSREPIPEDVKFEVWRRDQGRCVICGSQENLEFDHIIPFSKGGSSTARNIQLLCQNCNRHKSDKI